MRSSEAKSYPIIKGFEKQRTLPIISRQVESHRPEISLSVIGHNPESVLSDTMKPTEPRKVEDFGMSDADAIEYLSPTRLRRIDRQYGGEQVYADEPEHMTGQQKLQKYKLIGESSAIATEKDKDDSMVDFEEPYHEDTIGRGFNDDLHFAQADGRITARETEEHSHARVPYDTTSNFPDDDFGTQGSSSDAAYCEGHYMWPSISKQRPTRHSSHPYAIEQELSSPSPVRSFPRNGMSAQKKHSYQSSGLESRSTSPGGNVSSKIIGPSEGITRRAFEIARGKAHSDQQDVEDQGRESF